jgi:hypothetical protein
MASVAGGFHRGQAILEIFRAPTMQADSPAGTVAACMNL